MKFLFFLLFFISTLVSESSKKPMKIYSNSKFCEPCHKIQVTDWSNTWHSKSHTSSNILYKKTVEYISKESRKDIDIIKIECATCHNPRITKTKIKSYREYNIVKSFGLKTHETIAVEKALKDSHIKEGINCIVCHNIDAIKDKKGIYNRGHNLISWNKKSSVMSGPFDSDYFAYHSTVKRDFFREDVNKLCLTCHYGGVNSNGLAMYETGIEYEESNSTKSCVECHMGHHKESYIAKDLTYGRSSVQKRKVRSHLFAGVRNSDIVKEALSTSVGVNKNQLNVTLKNITPHKVPTGFGGRELLVEAIFHTNDKSIFETKKLGAIYKNNLGNETIPYLASLIKEDNRLSPYESRVFSFEIPKNTKSVEILISYKLINDTIQKLLDIKDETFIKKYVIIRHNLTF